MHKKEIEEGVEKRAEKQMGGKTLCDNGGVI